MPDHTDTDRIWDILESNSIGMLTTGFSGGLRARPLDARPNRKTGEIDFVTDTHGHKDEEIAAKPDVDFAVVVAKDNVYLSITGRATSRRDTAKAAEIWKKADDLWWKGGANDPDVRVLTVTPVLAELWDGPSNSLIAAYEFAKAKVTGDKPLLGENRKKTVTMG
jgi:general stress protein 26